MAEEAGKPVTQAQTEARRAAETFAQAAAEVSRYGGEVVPVDFDPAAAGYRASVSRFAAPPHFGQLTLT